MSKKQSEKDILKDIVNGKYRDCYLVYNRKSTDEADNQKNSISYQRTENCDFANRNKMKLAPVTLTGFCTDGVVSEKHSGFKEDDELYISNGMVQYRIDRPKFQQLLQHLSRGYFKGIVCLCWDRISRNKGDDTIIRKLMRNGVDIRFVYANYDKSSAGELHMDIDSMFSQHHSRVTSEKVTLSTKNSRLKGKCTYRAPIGYLNEGNMDYKPFDPVRAPVIKEMFELYATGDWSLADVARHAVQQGFTTVPMRRRRSKAEILADDSEDDEVIEKTSRPVTENHISRILTSRFYTGRTKGPDGVYIESTSHEALVSDDIYNQVQDNLNKKKVSVHYTEKLDHPLRGVVRCAHCQRVYTPYTKKGILYFNARCLKGCTNTMKNCNFDYIAGEIKGLVESLYFTDDELTQLEARASTDISLLEEKRHKSLNVVERKKKTIRENMAYLRSNRLSLLQSGVYTPQTFMDEEQKLEADLNQLKTDEEVSDVAMRDLMKDVVTLSELLKNVVPVYDFANPHEKEKIVKVIFSELFIAQDTLIYKVKKGFETFDDRMSAICDPTENRTPISWMRTMCPSR